MSHAKLCEFDPRQPHGNSNTKGLWMKIILTWFYVALLAISFLMAVRNAINGRKALEPTGFVGVVALIVLTILSTLLQWYLGIFNAIL